MQNEINTLKYRREVLAREINDLNMKMDKSGLTKNEDQRLVKAIFKHMEITSKWRAAQEKANRIKSRARELEIE